MAATWRLEAQQLIRCCIVYIDNFPVLADSENSGESPGTDIVFKPMRRPAAIGCDENAW